MKKKRRIEITAFRRTVTISSGPAANQEAEAPQAPHCGPRPAADPVAQRRQAELVEAIFSSIEGEPSADLENLIEVVASENDGPPPNRSD